MLSFKEELYRFSDDGGIVIGLDEAGRGPLAGPVYAAAFTYLGGAETMPFEPDDSKKLTEKRREQYFDLMRAEQCAGRCMFEAAGAAAWEIDLHNVREASMLAMRRALAALLARLEHTGCLLGDVIAVVDGDYLGSFGTYCRAVSEIKADGQFPSVACASIAAKVTRDRYMHAAANLGPLGDIYGFASHKGYGTREHYKALDTYGPSPLHRLSFLRRGNPYKK